MREQPGREEPVFELPPDQAFACGRGRKYTATRSRF
jgi:hypothetical protein